ncbi:uncharacterized protein LOC144704991 [Wolffia australiana]
MAAKTQLAAAILLLNTAFFTFASGQLIGTVLECVADTTQETTCNVMLSLVKCDGITPFVKDACCKLIAALTPEVIGKCLYAVANVNLLGIKLTINIPDSINLVLSACGKPGNILRC